MPVSAARQDYLDTLPLNEFARRRIRITVGCDDTREIPKVLDAGSTCEENGVRVQVMHNGVRVLEGGYHGQWMTEVIRLLQGHHEPQEERAFHELLGHLKPGANMLELGSFWAYYSLWFRKALPGGRSIMVEPDPNNLAVGQKNFAINHMSGEFHTASVGRKSRPPEPFLCESDHVERSIPEISVDELLRDIQLPRVDLLLADIQGAELEMLEGASRSLDQGRIRFLVLSTHHHNLSGDPQLHEKCLAFIHTHGGHILAEHTVDESFSGDGLIVASFDPSDRGLPPVQVSRNEPSNSLFHGVVTQEVSPNLPIDMVLRNDAGHPGFRWPSLLGTLRTKCGAIRRWRSMFRSLATSK